MRRAALDALLGMTAALLAVPALELLRPGPVALPGGTGVAVGVGLVGLAGARSARDLPTAVTPGRVLAGLTAPVASGAWFVHVSGTGLAAPGYAVGAVAAVTLAGAGVAAHECRLAAWEDASTTLATFEARPAPGRRRLVVGAATSVVAACLLLAGGLLAFGGARLTTVFPSLTGAFAGPSGALAGGSNDRETRVTDSGVRIGRVHRPWSRLASFTVTDGALVLHRPGRRPALTFDREDVDDLDAVTGALGRHLPRSHSSPDS